MSINEISSSEFEVKVCSKNTYGAHVTETVALNTIENGERAKTSKVSDNDRERCATRMAIEDIEEEKRLNKMFALDC